MTPERLNAIESSAKFASENTQPRCRCAGTCETCQWWTAIQESLSPATVMELCAALREARHLLQVERIATAGILQHRRRDPDADRGMRLG